MADKNEWQIAKSTGLYLGTANDKNDGFIHFSTKATVKESAAKHRAGEKNLLLLHVDSERLGDALKWESARGGILFPHLYASLKTDAVVREDDLPLGSDGVHIFPELG
jgi:uncharacterized protein (DUF952 family)